MVLKLVLALILLTPTTLLAAKPKKKAVKKSVSSGRTMYLKTAQEYYTKRDYKRSVQTLNRIYEIYQPSKLPVPVVQLLALNFLKLGQYNSASKYFHIVISKNYRKEHQLVLSALDRGKLEDLEVSEKLLRIYYHLGQSYYQIYTTNENTAYFRAAEKYFKICEIKEHLDDNATEYLENLSAKKAFVAKKEFTWKWFATAGALNWQEKLMLENSQNGNTTKLLSNARALCVGGGFRYTNAYHGFEVHGCGFSGSAKISSTDLSQTYQQDGVAVSGFILDSGYTIISSYEKASLTFSLPLFYRDGDYTQPNGYLIQGKGQLSAGAMLKGRWELPIVDLVLSFGNLGWTNLLLMQAAYTF